MSSCFDGRSRTFMRSVVADGESDAPGVGLLLFDEPSASLDPTAEHGGYFLFEFGIGWQLKLCSRVI